MDDVASIPAEIPIINHSRLLQLPAELREKIFTHIIPDVPDIGTWAIENAMLRPQLREDGEPCCPALLQINRKTHHEFSRLWYSNKQYTIFIGPRRLRDTKHMVIFCGSRFFKGDVLPTNIKLLRFAFLDINISVKKDVRVLLAGVVRQLLSPEMTLERLKIRITLSMELLALSRNDKVSGFVAHLEANLSKLKRLRHVTDVSVEVDVYYEFSSIIWENIIDEPHRAARVDLTRHYVQWLLGREATDITTGIHCRFFD
jgi:hypothetical protein